MIVQLANEAAGSPPPRGRLVPTTLCELFVSETGDPSGPAALLWPSLFTDHDMWASQIAQLGRAGWRVLAIDPPSHGLSASPGGAFSMEDCASAVIEVLDSLSIRDPVLLLGASWGGFVLPRVALTLRDRVLGLVVFSTSSDAPGLIERAKSMLMVTLMRFAVFDGLTDRLRTASLLSRSTRRRKPLVGDRLLDRYHSWRRQGLVNAAVCVLLDRKPFHDLLRMIRCPTLVVAGTDDAIFPVSRGRRIAAAIPLGQFREVAGAGHLAPLESPERVNVLLETFLGELSGERCRGRAPPST